MDLKRYIIQNTFQTLPTKFHFKLTIAMITIILIETDMINQSISVCKIINGKVKVH